MKLFQHITGLLKRKIFRKTILHRGHEIKIQVDAPEVTKTGDLMFKVSCIYDRQNVSIMVRENHIDNTISLQVEEARSYIDKLIKHPAIIQKVKDMVIKS